LVDYRRVIPAKAGIYLIIFWMPAQGRHDKYKQPPLPLGEGRIESNVRVEQLE